MDVLVLGFENPFRTRVTGGALEMRRRIQAIRQAGNPCWVYAVDKLDEDQTSNSLERVKVFTRKVSAATLARALVAPWPVAARNMPQLTALLSRIDLSRTTVLVEGLQMSSYIGTIRSRRAKRVILRLHNMESDYHFDLARAAGGLKGLLHRITGAQYRRLEKHFALFDSLHFISRDDAVLALERFPGLADRIHWVPPVASLVEESVTFATRASSSPCQVGYFGDLQVKANEHGIRWFVQNVWPLVLRRLPHAQFHVAGYGSEQIRGQAVVGHGYVRDLREFLGRIDMMVIPLFLGGGVKIKFLDTVGFGVPLVATPKAAEGTHFSDGRLVTLCDSPQEMAECIARVQSDPLSARACADQARDLLYEHYSASAYLRSLEL